MTSVVFHPSLGRFAGEELASGSESEGYYSRRQAAAVAPSRREVGLHHGAAPGSRRMRRHINDTTAFSESEYDTATDWESDEDRPIVKFEWEARFVQAGPSFFEHATLPPTRSAPPRRRRLPKMSRRKRGEAPQMELGDTDDEEDIEIVEMGAGNAAVSKREHVRRMRAAKFGADVTSAASSSSAPPSGSDSETHSTTAGADRLAPQGLQRSVVAERARPSLPGQECANTLFLQLEHSVRRALRRIDADDSVWSMLDELESLLVRYKRGRLTRSGEEVPHPASFDLLPPGSEPAAEEEEELRADPTSEDEDLMLVSSSRRHRSRASKHSHTHSRRHGEKASKDVSGVDAPLHLVFRSSFERYLAHGVIHFHQLVGESYTSSADVRVTRVRTPRAGVLLHAARIVPFLQAKPRNNNAYPFTR